jgi:pimeloyl-ACP methyl ester carboxylesterase
VSTDQVQMREEVHKDYPLTIWELGSGPPLLFLHGAGGAANMFAGPKPAAFLTELAKSFRVIVTEHPGFGVKERPAWLDNIHDMAYFYLDFLETLGSEKVHVLGMSLGGWVALEMAVRNTRRMASLTAAGAAGLRLKGVKKEDIFLWTRDDFLLHMFRNPEAAKAFASHEPSPDQLKAMLRNNETLALLGWEPRMYDPDLHKWLHRIDVPTHIVWADDDVVMPAPYGEALNKMIRGSKLSVVPNTGHLLHLDEPQAFSATVQAFIQEQAA